MQFELIQVALGQRDSLSHIPTNKEWSDLYEESIKQSVVGIAYEGLLKLPKGQYPPEDLLFKWIELFELISANNKLLNIRSVEVSEMFSGAGFRNCILKGQGNSTMYPNPYSRTPGDIDIWLDANRTDINNFVKHKCPSAQEGKQHIIFPVFNDVVVEVHYKPSFLRIPKYDKQLQAYFKTHADDQFNNRQCLPDINGEISIPTPSFNLVYQMVHLMSHFFVEGVGLRHFVDYYYVLKNVEGLFDPDDAKRLFDCLGITKFARGVMWVEKECLMLENKYLFVEPDEIIGQAIMKEMMEGGNFGRFDKRYIYRKKGYLARGLTDTYRLLKLSSLFPSEALWMILGKIKNQVRKIRAVLN